MKIRSLLSLLTAACLLSSLAYADEVDITPEKTEAKGDAAFEPTFGVVFNLQNIFQNPGVLSGFNGGVGVQLPLSTDLSLRPTVSLRRSSNPAVVTTTVTTVNDMTTTERTMTRPSPTSTFGITLGADLLKRLMTGNLAPYAGVGLMLDVSTQNTYWRDDVTVMDVVSVRNDSSTSFGFGGRGILGVGWRVHPHFLIFAEYAVNLLFVDVTANSAFSELTQMGASPATVKSNSTVTRVFEFSTGLSQGAALGLVAFF